MNWFLFIFFICFYWKLSIANSVCLMCVYMLYSVITVVDIAAINALSGWFTLATCTRTKPFLMYCAQIQVYYHHISAFLLHSFNSQCATHPSYATFNVRATFKYKIYDTQPLLLYSVCILHYIFVFAFSFAIIFCCFSLWNII